MQIYIKGAGVNGEVALVSKKGHLLVNSVVESTMAYESEQNGNGFIIATGFIPLTTTGSFNGVLYLKNTDTKNRPFHIEHLRVCASLAAAGSSLQVQLKRDVSTGTLISDANNAIKSNINDDSGNTFNGDAYTASTDGKTITNGVDFTQFSNAAPGHSIQDYEGAISISKNRTLSIEIKPSVAMTVCIELLGYFKGE